MKILFYDPYFFITKNSGKNFDIAGFSIDNTFNVGIKIFIKKKKTKIIKVKFKKKT